MTQKLSPLDEDFRAMLTVVSVSFVRLQGPWMNERLFTCLADVGSFGFMLKLVAFQAGVESELAVAVTAGPLALARLHLQGRFPKERFDADGYATWVITGSLVIFRVWRF